MRKIWNEAEIKILLETYPHDNTINVANNLNRTYCSVAGMATILQLKKSEKFFEGVLSGRLKLGNVKGNSTVFKKGHIPFNKGKKQVDYMTADKIENSKVNQYKKGQDPHNTVAIGSERITVDGYVEVKIRHCKNNEGKNRNFVLKQRLVYEQHFGLIPKDNVIGFKDGNTLNFEPGNLVLMSRKENMVKNSLCDNSIVKRFLGIKNPEILEAIKSEMPHIIEIKRNQILLNQQINKKDAVR